MDPERRVLVMDDDREARELLALLLEANGLRVLQASNGFEALSLLESTKPHLILLDIAMPVMDGIRFRQLQLRHPTAAAVPVIVLTGCDTQQLPPIDAFRFFRKPFSPVQLIEEVTFVLSDCSTLSVKQ